MIQSDLFPFLNDFRLQPKLRGKNEQSEVKSFPKWRNFEMDVEMNLLFHGGDLHCNVKYIFNKSCNVWKPPTERRKKEKSIYDNNPTKCL